MDLQTYICWKYGWAYVRPSGLSLCLKYSKGSLRKFKALGNKLNIKCKYLGY